MTAKTQQSQPTVENEVADEILAETPAETAADVVELPSKRSGNALLTFVAKRSETVQNKVKLVQDARARFSDAAKLSLAGDKEADKATDKAAEGAMLLYQGMRDGVISSEEGSEILGTAFGWKTKSDGSQSKTPAGLGEATRKRVNRAVKAYDYAINGNEPIAFFEPLERNDVSGFIHEMEAGKRSIWSVYDDLGKLKAEKTGKRPKMAFDPRRIAGLTADIGANIKTTVATVQTTPGLFAAYAGLLAILNVIGQELPDETAEAA